MTSTAWSVALERFVAEIRSLYGPRLQQIILFGSCARMAPDLGSDIDTLIVLNQSAGFWTEFRRISPVASRVSLEHDVVISAFPVDQEEIRQPRKPLLINALREGVRVG